MGQRPARLTRKSDSRPNRVGPCPTVATMTLPVPPLSGRPLQKNCLQRLPACHDLVRPCPEVPSPQVVPPCSWKSFVSKAARDRGFSCAPVDHANKASGIKVLHIDLCGQAGRSLLKGVLENPDVRWVHWAPPCGTFSQAREVRRKGAPLPLETSALSKASGTFQDSRTVSASNGQTHLSNL